MRGGDAPARQLWDSAGRAAEAEVPVASQRRVSSAILIPFCLYFCFPESFLVPLLLVYEGDAQRCQEEDGGVIQ